MMSNVLKSLPSLTPGLFTWRGNEGGAFLSDMGPYNPISAPRAFRVFDDAIDIGFYVTSTKTGKRQLFVHESDMRSSENEIEGWLFTSWPLKPGLPPIRIKVFND